jgi:hypothetical protein
MPDTPNIVAAKSYFSAQHYGDLDDAFCDYVHPDFRFVVSCVCNDELRAAIPWAGYEHTLERLPPGWCDNDNKLMEQMQEAVASDGHHIRLSVHSGVVWHQGKILIVDTGAGNDKERPHAPYFDHLKTPYLSRLRAIGVVPRNVDYILHTHLHVDHVGWNAMLIIGRRQPRLRNPRHVFQRRNMPTSPTRRT